MQFEQFLPPTKSTVLRNMVVGFCPAAQHKTFKLKGVLHQELEIVTEGTSCFTLVLQRCSFIS